MKRLELTEAESRWLTLLLQKLSRGSSYIYRGKTFKGNAERVLVKLAAPTEGEK